MRISLDHLEDNIRRVIADIRPQMLEKVIENWTSRLDYIRASRGSPMPEIIFKMLIPVAVNSKQNKSHVVTPHMDIIVKQVDWRINASLIVKNGYRSRYKPPEAAFPKTKKTKEAGADFNLRSRLGVIVNYHLLPVARVSTALPSALTRLRLHRQIP
ncbi:hypothetical protein TNCV_802501 [Trichonephila clavipes]|nr:hypothetical protein TNCV_802501 [Trichonephila clavipes]